MRISRSRVSGLLTAFLIVVPAGASADENKVTITMGNPGDHWLDAMPFLRVARDQREKHFGYEVTYRLPGMGEHTLFWPRSKIDLDGSAPRKYRMQFMKLEQGRLYLPDRITSESLPGVYKAIITIEGDYKKQARGGKAAAEAFTTVVTLAGALPARGSSLAARTSTSRTSTSASAKPSAAKPGAAKPTQARPTLAKPNAARAAGTSLKDFSNVVTRTTRGGGRGVRLTRPDGRVVDITAKRVKEFVPNTHPSAPPGTLQRVKFPNAQPGTKGFKRDPTPDELRLLEEAFK